MEQKSLSGIYLYYSEVSTIMNQRGFTMVELLMVMLVFTIMAGVAVPHMSDFSSKRDLDNAANELVADLRWIQQLSINAGVLKNSGKDDRLIPHLILNPGSPSGYWITLNDNSLKTVILTKKISINCMNKDMFCFGINGDTAIPRTITLTSGKNYRNVIVDKAGRVRAENGTYF